MTLKHDADVPVRTGQGLSRKIQGRLKYILS